METIYLIDFENVNSDGLAGCDKLEDTDHIVIFFTQNAAKINMSDIANHGKASLDMVEVPAGKQSTDIHIGSYIGYLIGHNGDKPISIVIVSNDTDFDNLMKFWMANSGVTIRRAKQIKQSAAKEKAPAKSKAKQAKAQPKANEIKTDVNNNIQQILSKAGVDGAIVNNVASVVANNLNVQNSKQKIYRAIISKYGQNKGLEVYNLIKKEL